MKHNDNIDNNSCLNKIINILKNYKATAVLFVILSIALIISFFIEPGSPISSILCLGMGVVIGLVIFRVKNFEDGDRYIFRSLIITMCWSTSALVFVDFKEFSLILILKIVTAFEFIFLGCILPDLMAELRKYEK